MGGTVRRDAEPLCCDQRRTAEPGRSRIRQFRIERHAAAKEIRKDAAIRKQEICRGLEGGLSEQGLHGGAVFARASAQPLSLAASLSTASVLSTGVFAA